MARTFLIFTLIAFILAGCTADSQISPSPPAVETTRPTEAGEEQVISSTTLQPTATTPPSATPVDKEPTAPVETTPPTSESVEGGARIAFIDDDGNIRLLDQASGDTRQVTQDAALLDPGGGTQGPVVNYWDLQWSSDGQFLAFRQEVGTPIASGFEYEYSMWIFDFSEGESRPLLEGQRVFNYAWKPGAHIIAYGIPIPMEYFLDQSAELAVGIWAVDVDSGETYPLVEPQRGMALSHPQWAAGGRFLSFEEILYMEGSGQFAYYDFEAGQYVAWDEVIGFYSWSPDGSQVAYDMISYVPVGGERIWLRDRLGETEARPLTPQYENGYAYNPVFSPDGGRIAFLADLGDPQSNLAILSVVELSGGEPLELGQFENVQNLAWTPDGERLVLSSGPFRTRAVMEVAVAEPSVQMLTLGAGPAWQPTP